MYFCNMLGDKGIGTFGGASGFPFVNTYAGTMPDMVLTVEDGKVKVAPEGSGENILLKGLVGEPGMYNETFNKKLTMSDVADTEDNPLIAILCNSFRVYDNIPADIKVLYINEDMFLVMLVSGYASFQGLDFDLERCVEYSMSVERKYKEYTAKNLRDTLPGRSIYIDEESGYNFLRDAVFHVRIKYQSRSESVGYICASDDTVVFNPVRLEEKRRRAKERIRIAEERELRKRLEKEEKERREREIREQREAERVAAEDKVRSKQAKEFLSILANMCV